MPILALLESGASGIDTGLLTQIIALVKSVMSLFGEYPLNVILLMSLAGGAFALFRRAKKAAK